MNPDLATRTIREKSVSSPTVSPQPTTSQTAGHLGYLDGLRAMAALYVVLYHLVCQVVAGLDLRALTFLQGFMFGRYAVDLFIVLSGFCLMLPVVKHAGELRGGALNFFKRRAQRILPPYYISMFFSLLLVATLIGHKTGTLWDNSLPVTGKSIWSHLLLVHDFVGEDFSINGPFWSIAVEWRIYFLFPLLVLLWRRLGPWTTTLVSIVGSLFLCFALKKAVGTTLTSVYIGLFTVGMLATTISFSAEARFERCRRLPWGAFCAVMSLLVGVLSIILFHKGKPQSLVIPMDEVMGLWALTLVVWVSMGNNWGHKLLSWKPLVWIGTFAYSIYLIHVPLIQLLWQYPFARLQHAPLAMLLALFVVGTPLMIGVSYGFFLAFERPFLRRRALARPEALVVKTVLEPAP